jgi:DNA polymerase-4
VQRKEILNILFYWKKIMSNKIIFHLDLDAFFAAVEEIKKPSYKNKPLIIGGRTRNSVVLTCN